MNSQPAVILEYRGLLRARGPDVRSFLQGIISNDVERVSCEHAIWSALLTPQGKFLHEFFLLQEKEGDENALFFDCELARRDDLKKRLSLFKLRSKVELEDVTGDIVIVALPGIEALDRLGLPHEPGTMRYLGPVLAYTDPRLSALGARAILPREDLQGFLDRHGFGLEDLAAYDRVRLTLGVPDGSRDMEIDKSILLECGFDELKGVDWAKGCFLGQELTARTKYRGLVKKRLLPVRIEGEPPASGTALLKDGKEVGVMRSSSGDRGLALLRLEQSGVAEIAAGEGAPLEAAGSQVIPSKPDWAEF